jgi:hypothetical protein
VKVPAEEVGWGLTPGSGGLSGLPTDEKQPEVGLETADRFIHHVPWEYPFLECCRYPTGSLSTREIVPDFGRIT